MDDLRARTTLFCGIIAFAIALSMLLRGRRPVHLLFAAFATTVAAWYVSQSLADLSRLPFWTRVTGVLTVLLPQTATFLFQAVVPLPAGQRSQLPRFAAVASVPLIALELSPYSEAPIALGLVYSYVLGLLALSLLALWRRGQRSPSRAVRDRVRFLVAVGALAATFTLADFLSFLGVYLPPIGAVLAVVFLFVLAESLTRPRLADLYELAGRLLVSTVLAFALAGIFYAFIMYLGRYGTMYLNATLAAIVFLLLFEPLEQQVEDRIHKFFFRERYDLETSCAELKRRLGYALEPEDMVQVLLDGLERSRRVTSCALYVRDHDAKGFDLLGAVGTTAAPHVDGLAVRPLLERLTTLGSVSLEEVAEGVEVGDDPALREANGPLLTAGESFGELRRALVFAVRVESDEAVALLLVADDRVRDAFTPEEVVLLETVAAQIGVALANTRLYARMKERDRLAAMGSMAAGLAHEVKNPLGAIKGAAQLLEEMPDGAGQSEFLGIILEETDRLNRVVGSFLDYARPNAGSPVPVDVNAAVRRTVQILSSEQGEVDWTLELADPVPRVKIDPEKFRQVLINLIQNGVQAMNGRGRLTVTTVHRRGGRPSFATGPASDRSGGAGRPGEAVEIGVSDTGPGIPQKVLQSLFVPFFSTKEKGTGLGLAISQSIIQNAGGTIQVKSQASSGTSFTVVLPVVEERTTTPPPADPAALATPEPPMTRQP